MYTFGDGCPSNLSDIKKSRLDIVESEIRKEKAEALGKAGERLEHALQELQRSREDFFRLLAAGASASLEGRAAMALAIERKVAEYAALREQARQLRLALVIQREALGLWRHEDVDRQYPLPGPLAVPGPAPHEAER